MRDVAVAGRDTWAVQARLAVADRKTRVGEDVAVVAPEVVGSPVPAGCSEWVVERTRLRVAGHDIMDVAPTSEAEEGKCAGGNAEGPVPAWAEPLVSLGILDSYSKARSRRLQEVSCCLATWVWRRDPYVASDTRQAY